MAAVSMPMYDLPETRAFLDSFWQGLRRHLRREGISNLPHRVSHAAVFDLWNAPDLLLSQCCGLDLVGRYANRLLPLATPHYGAPGCKGSEYSSVVVVADHVLDDDVLDMAGAVCVINGWESHSGMNALRALVAPRSHAGHFFSAVKRSGSHAASIDMLRGGDADVTCIDCVTYALIESYRPSALAGTHQLGLTYFAPAIPYITRTSMNEDTIERLRAGLFSAFADPLLTDVRRALYLKKLEDLPPAEYLRIADWKVFAQQYGYPLLR